AVGGNDVVLETAGAARRDAARAAGAWILDEHQLAVRVEGLREVSLPLELGGHPIETDRAGLLHLRRFERIEEEQLLVVLLVEQPGNLHGTADGESGIVNVELCLRQPLTVVLPGVCVPRVALAVPEGAPLIRRAPALAHDLDVRAAGVS